MSVDWSKEEFALFILTHNRAQYQLTARALRRQNYTGPIFYVVDDGDPELKEYKEQYGDAVCVFSKKDYLDQVDRGDNDPSLGGVVFARNAVYDIAEQRGVKWFIQADDDFMHFLWFFSLPYLIGRGSYVRDLDRLFKNVLDFYREIPAEVVALAETGDFHGGITSSMARAGPALYRKAMCIYFCSTERRVRFAGRLNEDVSMYVAEGLRGKLVFTISWAGIKQVLTQYRKGGLTPLYVGTYRKTMYSVMMFPGCVKAGVLNSRHPRIHHVVLWNQTAAKIVDQSYAR